MGKFNLKYELEMLAEAKKNEIYKGNFPYKKENLRRFAKKIVSFYYISITISDSAQTGLTGLTTNIDNINKQTISETMLKQTIVYYKLGITSREPAVRIKEIEMDLATSLRADAFKVSLIDVARFDGRRAVYIEGFIHKRLKKYKTKKKILNSGNSEVYCVDIFGINNEP